jgi:hypothetical protein
MTQETVETFVDGPDLVPHPIDGMVPLYEGHPPDTILPSWRCPDCGTTMPSIRDVWEADRRRERLAHEREEYEYGTDEWDALNEGVHHYRRRVDKLLGALPSNITAWLTRDVDYGDALRTDYDENTEDN